MVKLRTFLTAAITAAAIVVITCGLALWQIPNVQVASLSNAKGIDAKGLINAENDSRTTLAQTIATLAQILGGFAVLIGAYFAWRNLTATARSLELTNQNLELTKEGQVTERFARAIEQLGATDNNGKPKLELRLGGIYALERIARDSEQDHWPVMEVLTAYVRENAPWEKANLLANRMPHTAQTQRPGPLSTDIQAIMTVISHRERNHEKGQHLDLHAADLHGANLMGAYLWNAHLEDANLTGAHLEDANLIGARLAGAQLEDAYLRGASMCADLAGANLMGAHLAGAHLIGAQMEGAYLWGTDLTDTIGVTQEQVNSARGDATTRLPPGLVMPEPWKKKASSLI